METKNKTDIELHLQQLHHQHLIVLPVVGSTMIQQRKYISELQLLKKKLLIQTLLTVIIWKSAPV